MIDPVDQEQLLDQWKDDVFYTIAIPNATRKGVMVKGLLVVWLANVINWISKFLFIYLLQKNTYLCIIHFVKLKIITLL